MDNQSLKYYCDDTFKRDDDEKWNYLLDYAFKIADEVEFNILYSDHELTPEIEALSEDLIEKQKRKNKIYPSGYSLRYRLTDKLKEFIKSKRYSDWEGYNLEDASFLKNGTEFLATVTHENQVILQCSEGQRNTLKEKGFNFWCDWGNDPAKENAEYHSKSWFDRLKDRFK